MPAFLAVALGGTALFLSLLLWRFGFAPRWPRPWARWAVAGGLLVLTALLFLGLGPWLDGLSPAAARPLAWVGTTWMAAALYLTLGLVVGWCLAVVAWLSGWRGPRSDRRHRLNRWTAVVSLVGSLGVTAYGVAKAADPVVTPRVVTSAALPDGLDGMTVALVTDIHAGAIRSADFTARVVDRVNAAHPDLVILGGDLIDGEESRYAAEIAPLARLQAPLGVYAVTGNHEMFSRDVPAWLTEWQRLGITVLGNRSVTLSWHGTPFVLAGVHDYSGDGALAPDPGAALSGVDPAAYTVFVAHQPRQAFSVQGRGVDLQLSGHTHGGQLWPVRYLVGLQQPMVDGYAVLGDVPTVTSRGAGAWGPAVRVGADPEIPLLTLRRS